jgi:biopolymer transport protein ExbD
MHFRRRSRGRFDEAVIDVTSLIDAAFILIIFLLVTTSFKRKEHAFDVTLPTASSQEVVIATQSPVVFISSAGQFQLVAPNGSEASAEDARPLAAPMNSPELQSALVALIQADPESPLRLVVDRDTAYQHLITAINAARQAGVRQLQFPYESGDPGDSPTP